MGGAIGRLHVSVIAQKADKEGPHEPLITRTSTLHSFKLLGLA